MKLLGIIGGVGPQSSIDLCQKILNITEANTDQDHIPYIMDCNTQIPDRTDAILNVGPSPLPAFKESIDRLERAGVEAIAICCNTAHYYYRDLKAYSKVPLWNLIEIGTEACLPFKKVAALSTSGTYKSALYLKALKNMGIDYQDLGEGDLDLLDRVIFKVKAGDLIPYKKEMEDLIVRCIEDGCQAFLMGCTELPIAFRNYDFDIVTIDPIDSLAEKAVLWSGGKLKDDGKTSKEFKG